MNNMKKATLIFVVFLVSVISLAWASPFIYEWMSPEIPIVAGLTGEVTWTGTPIVGETITITVTIDNPTASDVSGTLVVTVYEADDTLDQELFNGGITVLTTGFTNDYTWTANLGNHYANATFTG